MANDFDPVQTLNTILASKLDELAQKIERELQAEVGRHSQSGNAVASIHVEETGTLSRFIGSHINWGDSNDGGLHFYYLDQGNAPRNGKSRIYPTRSRALHLKNIGDKVWAASVTPYKGKHIVKAVADRHR